MYTSNFRFLTFFALYTAVGIFLLLLGIGPALSNSLPAVKDTFQAWGDSGGPLAGLWVGMVGASQFSESPSRVVLDYSFSVLNIGLGVFIVLQRPKEWAVRLLGMAFVGTGSVFNFHGPRRSRVALCPTMELLRRRSSRVSRYLRCNVRTCPSDLSKRQTCAEVVSVGHCYRLFADGPHD